MATIGSAIITEVLGGAAIKVVPVFIKAIQDDGRIDKGEWSEMLNSILPGMSDEETSAKQLAPQIVINFTAPAISEESIEKLIGILGETLKNFEGTSREDPE